MATVEETKKMIKVMQAFINGSKIEFRYDIAGNEDWQTDDSPAWNWRRFDYRIKKEPSSKFRVGDYVLVLNGKDIPKYACGWVEDMENYVGKIFRIGSIVGEGVYRLEFTDSPYYFDERGLALVEVITKEVKK